MQISRLILAASLAALAESQSLAGLPTCANPCVAQYSSSNTVAGCSTFDIACICRSSTFISSIACCLQSSCNAADQATAIAFAQNLCSTAGVTVPSSVDGLCTSSTSQSASSSRSSTIAAASSMASSSASTATASSSGASSASSAVTSGATSSTVAANSATSSRAATSTAAANNVIYGGGNFGIAGGVAAILALL